MKILLPILLLLSFGGYAQSAPLKVYKRDGVEVKSYNFTRFKPWLEKENDTIYVVNFWATWCAPCVKELPHFEALGQKYKNEKIKILLVSLDMAKQVENALIPFINRRKLNQEVIHLHDPDADAWIPRVNASWSGALPATLIYSASKRKFYEREFSLDELEVELNKFK